MDERYRPGATGIERLRDFVGINRTAPFGANVDGTAAATLDDVAHALAKDAVDADNNVVAGLGAVNQRCLHSSAAIAGYRNGDLIFRLENLAKHVLDIVHA